MLGGADVEVGPYRTFSAEVVLQSSVTNAVFWGCGPRRSHDTGGGRELHRLPARHPHTLATLANDGTSALTLSL